MRLKKIIAIVCSISLILTGCCSIAASKIPTLLDPVSAQKEYGIVRRGELGDKKFYDAYITPSLVCVSSAADGYLTGECKKTGDSVKEGEILLQMNTDDLDEQIKLYTDKLSALDEIYALTNELHQKDITVNQSGQAASATEVSITRDKRDQLQQNIRTEKKQKKQTGSVSQNTIKEQTKELNEYENQNALYQEDLNDYSHKKEAGILSQTMDTQLYQLQRESCQNALSELKTRKELYQFKAPCDGVILSTYYEQENSVSSDPRLMPANTPLVMIGKADENYIEIPTLQESDLKGDFYAYARVGEKDYPLTQVPQDTHLKILNKQLQQENGSSLTDLSVHFAVPAPLKNMQAGQFVSVYIQDTVTENVCIAPNDSIYKENGSYYVIRCTDGKEEKVPVKLGAKSKQESEIIEGVTEGDILLSKKVFFELEGAKETALTRSDFEWKDKIRAFYLDNPYVSVASCRADTARLKEICVSENQEVKKGDILAKATLYSHQSSITRLSYQLTTLTQDEENEIASINKQQTSINGASQQMPADDPRQSVLRNQSSYFDTLKKLTQAKYKYERLSVTEQLNQLKKEESYSVIRAERDGIVSYVNKKRIGQTITPADSIVEITTAGSSVICINDEANTMPYGAQATFTAVLNGKETEVKGKLTKAMNTTVPWLRTEEDFITYITSQSAMDETAYRTIKNLSVLSKKYKSCYQITPKMKFEDEYGTYVYLLENGKRTKKYVTLSETHEGTIVVLDGISEDCVVLEREKE